MKSNRSLWVILFGVPALLVLPVAIVGSSVYSAGSIDVDVLDKSGDGCNIGIHVPAAAVSAAAHLVPHVTIDGVRQEMDREAQQALEMVAAVADELERLPDGVFVDVRDGFDLVTIEKRDGRMRIFVDTPEERVEISFPVRAVRQALGALDLI